MKHAPNGSHLWHGYGGEITVHDCTCGESFDEKADLLHHIEAESLERMRSEHYDASAGTQ